MAQVFVSYASPDRSHVAGLVAALEAEGLSVWWDRDLIPGPTFDREIEKAIEASTCVIVVWSTAALASDWVRADADEGARRGILVPVRIDDATPPLAHRNRQTVDLSSWDGARSGPFADLLVGVAATLRGDRTGLSSDLPVPGPSARATRKPLWSALALALVGTMALLFLCPERRTASAHRACTGSPGRAGGALHCRAALH